MYILQCFDAIVVRFLVCHQTRDTSLSLHKSKPSVHEPAHENPHTTDLQTTTNLCMYTHLTARSRFLRPLVAVIFCASLLISYIFLKSRPSYQLYTTLAEHEIEHSRQFIRNHRDSKYVVFKQLRGAGFNNQVGFYPSIYFLNSSYHC